MFTLVDKNTTYCTIVLFGATGDLALRKLYPSIYKLYKKGKLCDHFAIIGVARRAWSNEVFHENVENSIKKANIPIENDMREFLQHFFYLSLNVSKKEDYQNLNQLLQELEQKFHIPSNRMFYLAMAPEFFGTIASFLKSEGVINNEGWNRLIIEKPFGHNFASAKELNEQIRQAFDEEQIFRIDHYLGKEMVQNIEVIRFSNAMFEPLWNNQFISNIQITSSEILGVENRGGYYDKSGALRDMVQNHMLQMVSLIAMEPPIRLTPKEIRSEKIKVLRALRPITVEEVDHYFVRGQYGPGIVNGKEVPGYRSEPNIDPHSNTETFVAGKLLIENFRFAGVPIYIRTGKRMVEKSTKIVVQFKDLPMNLYYKEKLMHPNLLIIHIQPEEGISIIVNGKKMGSVTEATPVRLNYQTSSEDRMNTPEAYERLLHDAILGDSTNFTHWDEVALSWQFVDTIHQAWEQKPSTEFPNYESGSMGPLSADELLKKDGFHWWSF
jgi:glucose-6-phosphate 1-dehydrogenase